MAMMAVGPGHEQSAHADGEVMEKWDVDVGGDKPIRYVDRADLLLGREPYDVDAHRDGTLTSCPTRLGQLARVA